MLLKKYTPSLVPIFAVSALVGLQAQKNSSPNVLVIMTDQQRWDALQYSGVNNIIKTPNLDKLAATGAYFSQACSPCPVSGPARTSILTGRYSEKSGIRTNGDSDDNKPCPYKTFDQILADNGYVVEYFGKFHSPDYMANSYSNPAEYGYQGPKLIKNWEKLYHFYLNENTKKQQAKNTELIDFSFFDGASYTPTPIDRRYDKMPSGLLTDDELKNRQLVQPDHHGTLNLKSEHSITALQARQTIDALERNKANKFAITCSFHYPHSPILPTEPYASMYKPSEMPIPATIADKMLGNPYVKSNGRLLATEYADSAKIGYMIANYYALVTEIDDWVGQIIAKLDELKLRENTVILFMSDHGEMMGAHGMREKNVMLEESVRVSLIINYPAKVASRKIDTPVSLLNVFSTILDYVGVKAESDGFSLRDLANGKKEKYDFAVAEWNWPNQEVPNLMIRTREWKLLISRNNDKKHLDALFDLKNDPTELTNLLYSNKTANVKKAENLKAKLVEYLENVNYPYLEEIKRRTF